MTWNKTSHIDYVAYYPFLKMHVNFPIHEVNEGYPSSQKGQIQLFGLWGVHSNLFK